MGHGGVTGEPACRGSAGGGGPAPVPVTVSRNRVPAARVPLLALPWQRSRIVSDHPKDETVVIGSQTPNVISTVSCLNMDHQVSRMNSLLHI